MLDIKQKIARLVTFYERVFGIALAIPCSALLLASICRPCAFTVSQQWKESTGLRLLPFPMRSHR